MSRPRLVTQIPEPKEPEKPWAVHCDGKLEGGGECLSVFQRTEPFPDARTLRLASRAAGWKVAQTSRGLIDICPTCVIRYEKALRDRLAAAAGVEVL